MVRIIDVGVDACGILSRSVGQTNRKIIEWLFGVTGVSLLLIAQVYPGSAGLTMWQMSQMPRASGLRGASGNREKFFSLSVVK